MSLLLPRKKKIDELSLGQGKVAGTIRLGPAPKPVATYTNNPRQAVNIVPSANPGRIEAPRQRQATDFFKPVSQGGANPMRDVADFIGAGFQQGFGKVSDSAVKGGYALSDIGIRSNPFLSEEQKTQQLAQEYANTEAIRNRIKGVTDLGGRKVAATSDDISLQDIKSGDARKIAKLGGESLETGLAATQFINPMYQALKAGGQSFATLAKPIAKEALSFGGADALSSGAQTYGETGDISQAAKDAAITGVTSTLLQGGMLTAGNALGAGRSLNNPKTATDSTVQAAINNAEKVIADAQFQVDNGLNIPADVSKRLEDAGITAVNKRETPYGAEYDPSTRAINVRDQASATPDNLFHELGHDTFINRLTPEERAVFADSRGAGYNQAKGRKGYTAEDLVSEDFSNMYLKALKGEINSIPEKYRSIVAKYAEVALEEAELARPGAALELVQAARQMKDLKPRVTPKTRTEAPMPEMTRQITPANALSDQQLLEAQQLLNRPKVKLREAPNIVKEGDSLPVDSELDNAIPVYHGTDSDFKEFIIGKNPSSGVESKAIFFTSDKNAAKTYGNNVKEALLKLDDPIEIDFEGKSTTFFDGKWRTPSDLSKRIAEINDDLSNRYELDEDLLNELESLGWSPMYADYIDGAVLKNIDDPGKYSDSFSGKPTTNYLVSDTSKIKLRQATSQTPKVAYHSTAALQIENGALRPSLDGELGPGVYLHKNADSAKAAGAMQADGNLADQQALSVAIKTNNIAKLDGYKDGYPDPRLVDEIKSQGYDGIELDSGEIIIFNPDNVQVKNSPTRPRVESREAPNIVKEGDSLQVGKTAPKLTDAQLADRGIELNQVVTKLEGEMRDGRKFTQEQIDKANELMTLSQRVFYEKDLNALKRAEEIAKELTAPKPTLKDAPARPVVKSREAPNIVKEDGTVIGKTADLAERAESTPQPPDTVRLYQGTENGVPSPNYFDNIGQLENYYKYRSDGVDLQFVDVPADRAKRVAGKKGEAGVYEIDNDMSTSIDPVDPFNNRSIISKVRNELGSLVDSDAQMITMLRKIEKETGQKGLLDQWYFDSGNVRASKSIANAKLKNSEQLKEAFRGLNKNDLDAFDDYIAARAELMNYDGKNTSRSVAENEAIVRELAPEFEERFAQVNSYYKQLAQDMYDGGLIGEEQLAKYLSSDDYVRIQRDMEDLLGVKNGVSESRSIGTSKAVQKRKGSQREVLSPSLTIAKRTQEIELEIQRNKAANNIIDVLERSGLAQKADSSVNKNTVSRIVNGKREIYEVARDVKEVIDNVSPYQLGVVARVLSAPARLFRAGTTALSAPFTVTNYLRDQASSAVYSKQAFGRLTKNQQGNIDYIAGTHDPQNIIKGLASATKDFGYGSNDQLWKKFEMYAGDQTIYDELRNARNTKQMLREVRLGKRGKYANMVQNPIRTLEDLNSITEKATRFQNFKGTYEAVLRETGNEQMALQKGIIAARQNSVDFMRNSPFTRAMNLFIPYFNASIQGSRNVARSFRDRPVATATKSIALVALPAIAMELYNYSDEERRKVYESLDQYEKDNNFIIVGPNPVQTETGAWEGVYKVPKPQGYRELMQPAVDITRKFAQDEDSFNIEKMFTGVATGLSGPFNVSDPQKFVSGLIPQMAKPFIQQGMNKDLYTGNNIVPDFMQEETDDPTKRAFKSTSGTARLIANQLGISPIQVEKFITDVTGSLGRYGINASDNALATAGVIADDQIGGRSISKDFSRRLFEAQGELLPENKSDGRKYYESVTAASEPLDKNEKALFDSIHPSKTNFLGESIFDENKRVSKLTRAGAYLQSRDVFEADKQIEMDNRKNGNPANPLFDLPEEQLAKVLWKDTLPPGSNDPELSNLWRAEWYQDYQTKKSNYYDELKAKLKSEGKSFPKSKNPYPEASDQLQKAMTYYSSLPKGTGARSGFIKANADTWNQMIAHWNAIDNWENKERQDVGLSAIIKDSDGNIVLPFAIADSSGGSGSSSGGYSRRSGGSGSSNRVLNPRQYAIDINAGGQFAKPTVKAPAKSKVAGKYTARQKKALPKVTIKKSKV